MHLHRVRSLDAKGAVLVTKKQFALRKLQKLARVIQRRCKRQTEVFRFMRLCTCRYECLFLSLMYITYVVTLITTDKCLSPPVSDEEREFIEATTAAAVVGSRASMVVFRCVCVVSVVASFAKSPVHSGAPDLSPPAAALPRLCDHVKALRTSGPQAEFPAAE